MSYSLLPRMYTWKCKKRHGLHHTNQQLVTSLFYYIHADIMGQKLHDPAAGADEEKPIHRHKKNNSRKTYFP